MRTGRTEPNFAFLFGGMIVLLLGVPLVETVVGGRGALIGQIGTASLLLSGLWTLAASRVAFSIGTALVVVSIATAALAMFWPAPAVALTSIAITWTFCLLSVWLCGRYVLVRHRVTANHLLGATCIYLLLGALWGLAYAFIHMLHPGAFRTAEATESLDTGAFLYFSLVTLTTTGYGDMVPVSRLVRALASLEGVAGQLYVAILVATLVSQYVAPRGDEPEER